MSALKNISTSLCRHAFPYEWCLHNGTIVCLKMVLTFVKQTASLTDSKHTFLIAFRWCSGFTHGRNNFESMTYSIWALIPLYCPLGKQIMSERGMTGKMLQNRELWSTLSINNWSLSLHSIFPVYFVFNDWFIIQQSTEVILICPRTAYQTLSRMYYIIYVGWHEWIWINKYFVCI